MGSSSASTSGIAGAEGSNNVIQFGRGADTIQVTKDPGARNNSIESSRNTSVITRGGDAIQILKNGSSSANAVFIGYEATTDEYSADPAADYAFHIGAQKIAGKRGADGHDRARLDLLNGKVLIGNGSVAPTAGIEPVGSTSLRVTGDWYHPSKATAPGAIAGHAPLWFDETAGEFKFRRPDGTIRTITSS